MTLCSMTGFGRSQISFSQGLLCVEIRTVNQKGLDIKVRAPRELGSVESLLQKKVKAKLQRGRVDVAIQLQKEIEEGSSLAFDVVTADSMLKELHEYAEKKGLKLSISTQDLLRTKEMWKSRETNWDEEAAEQAVMEAIESALIELVDCRVQEGAALGEVLLAHIKVISTLSSQIEIKSEKAPKKLQEKLTQRLDKLQGDLATDPQRLAQEVALIAERVDTTEETDRLRMHVQHARDLLAKGSPVGRKLDFLCQEFLREANTCGSKCQDAEVAHLVVELKTEVERFREQVQNLE